MTTLPWTLQILFGLLFTFHGIMMAAKLGPMSEQLDQMPYSVGFLTFIGVCETLGGLGLLLPVWTGILPWLTPLAAAGLAIIMAGAVWTHISHHEVPQSAVTSLIVLALAFIAFARWPLFGALA